MSKTSIRIASIVLGIGIFSLAALLGFRIISSRASLSKAENVTISDVSQNSARISWSTQTGTIGAVKYGTSEGALSFYAPETVSTPSQNHSVELTLLSPGSVYYFQVQIGDEIFDNGGVSWTFSTKSKTDSGEAQGQLQPQPTQPPSTQPVTQTTLAPTPVQKIRVDSPPASSTVLPTNGPSVCTETTCDGIKAKLGQGCTGLDLAKNNCL